MKKLKDICKLRVTGYYQKNTSYFEEFNGSGRIDETYELIEKNTITPFGYEIKILKINDYSVNLLVNNEKVELKEGDKICVAYKNRTSGKNEDFIIDKEELYIELINANKYFYPHLIDFVDNREKINQNIKKVEKLIKNKFSYAEIKNHLKTILFRLTDEEYLNKQNIDFLMNERKLALPFKDVIEELICDIDIYFKECNKLLDVVLKNHKLDSEEYKYLAPYLYQLAIEHNSYEHIPFEKIGNLCTDISFRNIEVLRINITLTEKEMIEIHYLLMKIYSKSKMYFDKFYIARDLSNLLLNIDESMFNYKTLISINIDAGDYYQQIHDRPKAMEHYFIASEIANKNKDKEEAAYALYKYYKLNNAFPEKMKVEVDIDKIKKDFKEFADIIIKGINHKSIKICESEFDPIFINNYCFVMRDVEAEIEKVGDLNIPYQRWELIKRIYKNKYNIEWKTPKEMNPRIMFD